MQIIGIDIGSTSAKTAVFSDGEFIDFFIMPTGWSTVETAKNIKEKINSYGFLNPYFCATGYGRVSTKFAHKTLTEITAHAMGANFLFGKDCTVIDIGGQDTKAIKIENQIVTDFSMNDKCSAGTGKFLEIMSNRLALSLNELTNLAKEATLGLNISSTCTVFAESEIISLIANSTKREEIANAVIRSVVQKVAALAKKQENDTYFFTGGLSRNAYILQMLKNSLNAQIYTHKNAIYAGAIGAALYAKKHIKRQNVK